MDQFETNQFDDDQAPERAAQDGQGDSGNLEIPPTDGGEIPEIPEVLASELSSFGVSDVDNDGGAGADSVGAEGGAGETSQWDQPAPATDNGEQEFQPASDSDLDAWTADADGESELEREVGSAPPAEVEEVTSESDQPPTSSRDEQVAALLADAPTAGVAAGGDETEQSAEPAEPVASGSPVKSMSRMWKALSLVGVLGVLGLAGYMITPHLAFSASITGEELTALRAQLQQALAAQVEVSKQYTVAKTNLAEAAKRADFYEQAAEKVQGELAKTQQSLSETASELDHARLAIAPLQKELTAAKESISEAQVETAMAKGQIENLTSELTEAKQTVETLSAMNAGLSQTQGKLSQAVQSEQQTSAELKRLLKLLDLGSAEAPVAGRPAEMPISRKELFRRLGQPTVAVSDDNLQIARWGDSHMARTVGDIVVEIDGQPASRGVLASVASNTTWTGAPGKWRLDKGDALLYADLVSLFGKPLGVSGAGSKFQAWWPVGAWAREVTVTVENGVVTGLAGGQVDPTAVCHLVRHRLGAYKSATPAVKANTHAARQFYDIAAKYVAERMKSDARLKARDGVRLASCTPAAFDSVGVWIAPTDGPGGYMTMRAAVDCVWVKGDGGKTSERKYVIVTLTGEGEADEVDEFAVVTAAK